MQKNEKLQSAARGEILVVPPSTQTRVKVPVTLREKIKECNEPLVGLAHVRDAANKKKRDFLGIFPKCRTPLPPFWEPQIWAMVNQCAKTNLVPDCKPPAIAAKQRTTVGKVL